MKLYDIDYNLIDDEKLEDTFHNADDLRKINMPLEMKRDCRDFGYVQSTQDVGDNVSPTSAGTDGSWKA